MSRTRISSLGISVMAVLSWCSIGLAGSDRCTTNGYRGDGDIGRLARRYTPDVASYGYVIDLPKFSADQRTVKMYSLNGLPTWRETAHIALATYVPTQRMSMVEANMLAPEIPSNHVVSISLIHNGTNTTLCSTNLCIKSLPPTGALHFMGANFIKRLGEIDVKALGTTSNLQMSVTYDPHNAPLELRMAIVVIADAPTL